jgi:hypothetical protein
VSAHQELVCGAALELDQLELIGASRCLLIGSRRLDPATDVGEGIAQPRADSPRRGGVRLAQLERAAIELDSSIKGQCLARLVRRESIIKAGLPQLAGPLSVHGQRFGIGASGLLQLRGQTPIHFMQAVGVQMVDHRLPDAVVVGFHLVERSQTRAADQMLGAQ